MAPSFVAQSLSHAQPNIRLTNRDHRGNFHQSNITSKAPFERLLEATSPAAFHESDDIYDPPKCHPNTRVAVLNKIMDWIHGVDPETRDALTTWLYGPAGSGKSAIARSIAELSLARVVISMQNHLPLIFLIASRPEPDIRSAFGFGYLSQVSTRNPLDDDYLPSEDIFLFLRDKFAEIKTSHPFKAQILPTWPSEDALRTLVNNSSGQFIYASTVIRFVKSTRHRSPQRLDVILGVRPTHHELPFAELDALYMHTFLFVANP
ncbi:hypothetical protein GALMADRAFT_141108 [Galerina marginata CBS 339.88]|uniref:ATPase AAA-type core domain-containing protein n=1 Tax=Galerina marginata (strain CBS 339.88) TaxID=685588 RepID=A0A067T6X7_GALM3|nr:hypothetical protein GALMADRAFT_141108 [Galerina marginata CBS 339.88]